MKILLTEKLQLLARLASEPSACRKHFAVMIFVLDWFHEKYGDALASVGFITSKLKERDQYGRGVHRSKVGEAVADLVSWNYLIRTPGSGQGRAASRLVPNISLIHANKDATTTFESEFEVGNSAICIHDSEDAIVPVCKDASGVYVPAIKDKDPSTLTRREPRTVDGFINDSPSPASAALALATGEGEDFERLWQTYGVRRDKAKARAAFEAKCNSPAIAAEMLQSASAWAAAWTAGSGERKHLATWISEERYSEDPPVRKRPVAASSTNLAFPSVPVVLTRPAPIEATVFEVVSATDDGCTIMLGGKDGESLLITYQADTARVQEAGQLLLGKVAYACGIHHVTDAADFIGKRFIKRGDDFLPAPANDNIQIKEAA